MKMKKKKTVVFESTPKKKKVLKLYANSHTTACVRVQRSSSHGERIRLKREVKHNKKWRQR